MVNVSIIERFEGFRSEPYLCPANKPTIGFGSTFYEDGTKVTLQDKPITKERAREILNWYCDTQVKYPDGLNENQKSAVCSLIYNIGQSAFDRSKLKQAIINKDELGIRNEWTWYKANGKILTGLVLRRQAERELFFRE